MSNSRFPLDPSLAAHDAAIALRQIRVMQTPGPLVPRRRPFVRDSSATSQSSGEIASHLTKMRKDAAEGSEWHNSRAALDRKKTLDQYFDKFTEFEKRDDFTKAMREEWVDLLVGMVHYHHGCLNAGQWRVKEVQVGVFSSVIVRGETHPGAVDAKVLVRRSAWFE